MARRLEGLDPGHHLVDLALGAPLRLQGPRHPLLRRAPGPDHDPHLGQPEAQHDGAEERAHQEQHDQVEQGQGAVEQRGQRAGGEDLPHFAVALDPDEHPAGRAAGEEPVGQADEVGHEPVAEPPVEDGAQGDQEPGADDRRGEVVDHDADQADGEDGEQMAVGPGSDLVHDQARHDGQGHRRQPQQRRGDDDAGECPPFPGDEPEVAPGALPAPAPGHEAVPGGADDGDARVGLADLGQRQPPAAGRRIDDVDRLAPDLLQHHEVAEPPVEDRSRRQGGERVEIGGHPLGDEPVAPGGFHHRPGVDPVPVGPRLRPDLVQGEVEPVMGEGHGQTGRAAVGDLELRHERDPGSPHGSSPPNSGRTSTTSSRSDRTPTSGLFWPWVGAGTFSSTRTPNAAAAATRGTDGHGQNARRALRSSKSGGCPVGSAGRTELVEGRGPEHVAGRTGSRVRAPEAPASCPAAGRLRPVQPVEEGEEHELVVPVGGAEHSADVHVGEATAEG